MQNQAKSPFSSMMPILLIGLLAILFIQFFTSKPQKPTAGDDTTSESANAPSPIEKTSSSPTKPKPSSYKTNRAPNDFQFAKGRGSEYIIQTEKFLVRLSSRGARIEKFYLKSYDGLRLPKQVVEETNDPISQEYNALEITQGNGMDFQPHIYYSPPYEHQLGEPLLNQAAFQAKSKLYHKELGITELTYRVFLRFGKSRLQLQKTYRFYEHENYFRQITILRNLGNRPFDFSFEKDGKRVYGALFYKPFADIGHIFAKDDSTNQMASGKFFYYNQELIRRPNHYQGGGGGCGFPVGCTSSDQPGLYTIQTKAPNSLYFMGSNSRYFFAYTEFLAPENNHIDRPDGFIYKNNIGSNPKEAMTSVFLNFLLESRQRGDLDIGSPSTLLDKNGNFQKAQLGNRSRIELLQKVRKDALIIDNKVFVGVRSSDSHAFHNPNLMAAAFGAEGRNEEAAGVIHHSAYTAFFSGIQDIIISIMRWLYSFIGNYGWCIIVIAAFFKLLTFPLNQMQVKSMQNMSKLRPEMESLNKQYANDPKERQKRIMQLFRTHNVNPAKGCLPMLIQMPIFVGLYSAFSTSIELWQSPFILWMNDLSRPDTIFVIPYIGINFNVLPLLMVVSQILYQRFTSITTDPQQKMLMYFMPLLMLFFFWQIPSGVTLYWTIQNFISIAWQQASNYFDKDKRS